MEGAAALRAERAGDRAAVREAVTAAFGRADEADLVDELRSSGDCVYSLVAIEDARIVGHALFTRMAAPFPALALGPVAVVPERQGRGLGSRLIRAGLEAAAQAGWLGVFVLGDPAYYRRFGFEQALAAGFDSAYAGPHLMACALGVGLPVTTGRIDYAPAFARHGRA